MRQRTVTSVSMSLPSRVLNRRSSFSLRSPSLVLAVMIRFWVDVSYVVQSLSIGAKKYVAPGAAISVDRMILLNLTPTCVACVTCGVQAERVRASTLMQMQSVFMVAVLMVRREVSEVCRIPADVNRPFDAVEHRQAFAQAQQLVRAGSLHRSVDQLSAMRFGALDQEIGFRVF